MRDEFDPLHGHRAGWYQRELRPSRAAVVRAFRSLPEETLRGIVLEVLRTPHSSPLQVDGILAAVQSRKRLDPSELEVITRGITGRKAEEYFQCLLVSGQLPRPFRGMLRDCRDSGTGYDFVLRTPARRELLFEVKGARDDSQGISLTDKEWRIARERGDDYFIVVVSELDSQPRVRYLRNPAKYIHPTRHLSLTVSVSWSIPDPDLSPHLHDISTLCDRGGN